MKVTVLTDNNGSGSLGCEWGLSLWIEFEGKRILMDTGTTALFYENAEKLGIPVESADCAVISHAHYDHCGGMDRFFEVNSAAPAYLREGAKENCWHLKDGALGYIGIPKGMLDRHRGRIIPVTGVLELYPNVRIIPHTTVSDAREEDKTAAMLVMEEGKLIPDHFDHEQSLVIDTGDGLVIFSSCSHTGPVNILADVTRALPGRPLRAYIGGLHIYRFSPDRVRTLAREMESAGIRRIWTGHCTGEAFPYLKEIYGDRADQFYAGMIIDL